MPPRVAATFGMADFIAAEDTRVTLRLLNHLGLKKPMVSYYEHALHHGEAILNRIEAGENCALCSDAGMPCISDPGEQIVKDAIARGITVTPVPGASACVTALAVSGQDTARFVFEGFLPVPKRDRRERLAFLQNETRTMIFYEAPHKLRGTLDDLAAAFGADRPVSLCRELTKLHEEIKKTTLGEAVAYYKENDPRGEYVLVLAGADPAAVADAAAPTLEQAVAAARALQAGGLPPAAAAKQAALGYFEAAGYTVADGKITAAPAGGRMDAEVMVGGSGKGDHPSFMALTLASDALKEIGFNLIVSDMSNFAEMTNAINAGTADMFAMAWQATPDPDMFQIYHSQGGSNEKSYWIKDADLDELIMMARQSTDQTYRKTLYKQCLDIVADWAVEIPIYQRQNCVIFSAKRVNLDTVTPDITTYWTWYNDIELLDLQ